MKDLHLQAYSVHIRVHQCCLCILGKMQLLNVPDGAASAIVFGAPTGRSELVPCTLACPVRSRHHCRHPERPQGMSPSRTRLLHSTLPTGLASVDE
jgi:hypothetical protein